MMPRPNANNLDNDYPQSFSRGRSNQMAQFNPNQGFMTDDHLRRMQQQAPMPMNMQMMQQIDQPLMANMQQQMQSYHRDMAAARNSPSLQAMAAGGPQLYMEAMSPSVARMSTGMYQQQMTPGQTPTSPSAYDLQAPNSSQSATGSQAALSQAEREEELLLNLLIARRQRGRTDSKSTRNPSLAEELMRMRQSRQTQQQTRAGLPPVPGMPPLFSETSQAVSGLEYQHRAFKPEMNLTLHQEHMERIDRSPTRLMDARSQDMLDYSGRGLKRGPPIMAPPMQAGFDAVNLKFQAAMRMQDLETSPAKKKRKHKKKPADMPRRPLSAYNLFFSEERERILKEIDGKDDEGKEEDTKEESPSPKPKALMRPLIPSQKKRRPHRKTHGKISFQELARMVGERWKSLSEERREYYQDLAKEDMKRQKAAMEEYYAKQNAVKTAHKDKLESDSAKMEQEA